MMMTFVLESVSKVSALLKFSSTYPYPLPTSSLSSFLMIMKLGMHIQYSRTHMPIQMLGFLWLKCMIPEIKRHTASRCLQTRTHGVLPQITPRRISPPESFNIVWKPRFSPSLTETDDGWECV